MSAKIGLFTGSFDPITKGHLSIIERASQLFDKLYVGLFYNQEKKGFFDINQRQIFLRDSLAHLSNVEVIVAQNSLAVDVARQLQVTHLVRGLRHQADLDYEMSLTYFNKQLAQELETVFFLTDFQYQYVSSSRVRELIAFETDISPYVPDPVSKKVKSSYETHQKI
ncbi:MULTISPECIES: pantetheine-phosphate adenylyltransferase [unclassified Streptococcus]|uniref:pantetheine-phosphate adenylyltransferase n=1 Tax=unclassified Streptococcus TaxID=2608887 RepID=UPI0011B6E584|nr:MULTISPECIES: pantetheine-phosphate adenylyltransferase [unclassified Streptococcus]TWS94426.1 pantetheine-phosphate adenylyltransferase [Streptococcus sp. sy018]TWT14699.1 pantetheine-phosphate adenylyltransferase [Streptococcus sp. sy010]